MPAQLKQYENYQCFFKKRSAPETNAIANILNVKYPIITDNLFDKDTTFASDSNIVFIDNNCGSNHSEQIKKLCKIKTDENGYSYKGYRYNGDYCIMQIIPNPKNEKHSVLYINTNNVNLFNRNLFTRKVIIPTYANGYNPFWNNDALIFDGKDYFRIFDYGMNIEKINKTTANK